jgi:uncharacterized protein (TIGR02145 family)
MSKQTIILLIFLIGFSSCRKFVWDNPNDNMNANSNAYTVINIGNQYWMLSNLNVDKFRNGDIIPQAQTDAEWASAGQNKQPAWCYYNNELTNGQKFGKLYNWYAIIDSRGLAPEGWHIPSDNEWSFLINNLGGENTAGVKLKSNSEWLNSGNGNNASLFNGLPGGERRFDGVFNSFLETSAWWSTTEYELNRLSALYRYLNYNSSKVFRDYGFKERGMYVRCIKD